MNEPAGQGVHVALPLPVLAPNEPGAHWMHAICDEAPSVGACVPSGHGSGVTVPSSQ